LAASLGPFTISLSMPCLCKHWNPFTRETASWSKTDFLPQNPRVRRPFPVSDCLGSRPLGINLRPWSSRRLVPSNCVNENVAHSYQLRYRRSRNVADSCILEHLMVRWDSDFEATGVTSKVLGEQARPTQSNNWLSIPDVSIHLNPFVFLMADIFLHPKANSRPSKASLMVLSYSLIFSYGLWVEQCRSRNEWYPYPIMEEMSGTNRVIGSILLGTVVGLISIRLWGYQTGT
jgi:hypothetical protein